MNDVRAERRKFTAEEREVVLKKTNYRCAHCGKKLSQANMTVDHIFPMNKGGLNDEYNLLPLCLTCNETKSNYVYSIEDYYRHISKDEFTKFSMYNAFATFDYSRRSILGVDELVFEFIPYQYHEMLYRTAQRSKKEADKLANKLYVSLPLRRAYPGDAARIYEMMHSHINNTNYRIHETIYATEYAVVKAIENGVVYVLEKNNNICGAFMFESVSDVYNDLYIAQLENILDETGLKLKYIMTYATSTLFAGDVFSNVMECLVEKQLMNGWMPLFFNIIDNLYREADKCIKIPYQLCGFDGTIEFMPLQVIINNEMEYIKRIFKRNGYELDEYSMRRFAEYNIRYSYQNEFRDNKEVMEFFDEYPNLLPYFKPDTFELYDVGFVSLN